ncbi:hypothetical protein INR49_008407 [Caranx melampygus]|nr:hypothetical protein INR49_008407 [Caranx melampygus]
MILGSQSCLDYIHRSEHHDTCECRGGRLLLALSEDAERLKWFRGSWTDQGESVIVQEGREELRGIVRYIGPQKKPVMDHLAGTVFGIQLQGTDRRKGNTTPPTIMTPAIHCQKISQSFDSQLLLSSSSSSSSILEPPPVHSYSQSSCRSGQRQDENGKRGGEVRVPLENVVKGEVPAEAESMDTDAPGELNSDLYQDLSLNSMVELTLAAGMRTGSSGGSAS